VERQPELVEPYSHPPAAGAGGAAQLFARRY